MGLWDFLKQVLYWPPAPERYTCRPRSARQSDPPASDAAGTVMPGRLGTDELGRRLGLSVDQLTAVPTDYEEFTIAKRSGGRREIAAPAAPLKALQRTILHRLLARLKSHPTATGFERRHSIVTNAAAHTGADVVVRMDLRDFFPGTSARRVENYYRRIGWDARAAALLTKLCTHNGALPQGAPTSPRLSNLVNVPMDARLAALAKCVGAIYTRYADDMTFSLDVDAAKGLADTHASEWGRLMWGDASNWPDDPVRGATAAIIRCTKEIVGEYGYKLHQGKKLRIRRRHQCQLVTGLVVNDRPALPRAIRRLLRAVEHHLATGRPATLTKEQMQGWRALQQMIETQRT